MQSEFCHGDSWFISNVFYFQAKVSSYLHMIEIRYNFDFGEKLLMLFQRKNIKLRWTVQKGNVGGWKLMFLKWNLKCLRWLRTRVN